MKLAGFIKLRYLPRWIIICIDVFHTFVSIILSFLLRFNFNVERISKNLFISGVIYTVVVYFIFFFVFKSYKEVVRYTTFNGVLKIFLAVFTANMVLLAINFFPQDNFRAVPYSVVGINLFISFFMLAGSRIAIKQLFEEAFKRKKSPVLIFGAGAIGQAALHTIRNDRFSDWRVIGFVDDDLIKINKLLGNIKVYAIKEIEKIITQNYVSRIIIAVNNISVERRNEVADFFIRKGLQVSVLPHNQQWANDPFKIRRLRNINIEDLLEREPIQMNNEAISETLNGKCILITGAAGSIGSGIVKQVAAFEPKMLLLCDIAESPLHDIGLYMHENFDNIKYKLVIESVSDRQAMEKIFSRYKPDVIFHAAAYKHVPMMEAHPQQAVLNNILGTRNIADLAVQYDTERFVMISTDKAVNPTNVMGASKRIAEMYIQSLYPKIKKTLFITTRFGNVLDSNGSVLPRFKAQLAKGGPITLTHPDITRFFMTIPEACQLVLEAGVMGKGGEIFIFDMGESVRVKDLAEKMIRLAGLKPEEDIHIEITGLRPGEKLYEEVLNDLELTTETYHPKIKIAKVRHVEYEFINYYLNNLAFCAKNDSEWKCVKLMKEIVPEFKSNNSKFEQLDNQTLQKLSVIEKD